MRKFTLEEENYFIEKVREAQEDAEKNGTLTEDEFDAWLEEYEREYEENRRLEKSRKNIKLNTPRFIGKISKRFIRA